MTTSVQELIDMHSKAIEHYARAADPKTAFVSEGSKVVKKAQDIFSEELSKLDENEASEVLSFYRTSTGQKELKAADAVALALQGTSSNINSSWELVEMHTEKAEELVRVLNFECTLTGCTGSDNIPVTKIVKVFARAYGSLLSPEEIDDVIAFHKSAAGSRYTELSNMAGSKIAAQVFS